MSETRKEIIDEDVLLRATDLREQIARTIKRMHRKSERTAETRIDHPMFSGCEIQIRINKSFGEPTAHVVIDTLTWRDRSTKTMLCEWTALCPIDDYQKLLAHLSATLRVVSLFMPISMRYRCAKNGCGKLTMFSNGDRYEWRGGSEVSDARD